MMRFMMMAVIQRLVDCLGSMQNILGANTNSILCICMHSYVEENLQNENWNIIPGPYNFACTVHVLLSFWAIDMCHNVCVCLCDSVCVWGCMRGCVRHAIICQSKAIFNFPWPRRDVAVLLGQMPAKCYLVIKYVWTCVRDVFSCAICGCVCCLCVTCSDGRG